MKKTTLTTLALLSTVAAYPAFAQNCTTTEECTRMYNSKVEYKSGAYAAPEAAAPSQVQGDYSKVDDRDGKFTAYNIPAEQVKQNTVGTIVTKIYVPPSAPVSGENYVPVGTAPATSVATPVAPPTAPAAVTPPVIAPVVVTPPAVTPTVPAMTKSMEPSLVAPAIPMTPPTPVQLPPVVATPPADIKPMTSTDMPPMPPMPDATVSTPPVITPTAPVSDATLLAPPAEDMTLTLKPAMDGSGKMEPSLSTTPNGKSGKSFGHTKEIKENYN